MMRRSAQLSDYRVNAFQTKMGFPKLLFSVEKVNVPRSLYCAHWESSIPNNKQTGSVKKAFI